MASASELGYTNPSSTRLREEAALRARSSGFWGGIAEYYDFGLYGTAAAVIFPAVFFGGGENPVLANIASLASFGVAYLARPLGAIVLGNLGDTWGRKNTLYLTLGLMGMATLVIGFLPSYDQIGLAAPIILLFMRLVQGFSAGGEQAGSNTLTSELAPPSKRGRMTAWTMHGLLIGQLLGLAAFIPVSGNEEFLMSWGWRIPYFVAIPLVLFALWKRAKIREPRAVYERIAQLEGRTHEPNLGADCAVHKGKVSVITLFRHHLPNVVRVMMMAQYAITGVLLSNYLLNYATTYWGWERQTLLSLATMTMVLGLPTQPLWAALSDRIGRRPVYIISMVSLIVSFPVVFWSVQLENIGLLTTTMVVMGLMATGGNVVQAPLYTEIFPTEVRMTGYAVSTQLGNIIVGFTPMIAAMLVRPGAFGWVPVLIFTTIMMGMGVIACLSTKETMGAVIVAE
ncbi:MFS transporter [Trueperella pyogenes]|uniref:MFS transporter n=1 Tax=Trueperella pyogenes TaxID=1661 RepID=UPI0005820631|nr:MFS transporter [Trueperella pyogenes]AJC69065.1 3-(2-hydroxyphenyl) propionic acid transporter [Trueperella pyogenes TP8]UVJ55383.1 MFS transporter [Trueperella pyogenes]UVJ59371.1 MFS transporter [Trueperella pyogenes]WHU58053.1 MFS transporter [Trueperella pyogenes]